MNPLWHYYLRTIKLPWCCHGNVRTTSQSGLNLYQTILQEQTWWLTLTNINKNNIPQFQLYCVQRIVGNMAWGISWEQRITSRDTTCYYQTYWTIVPRSSFIFSFDVWWKIIFLTTNAHYLEHNVMTLLYCSYKRSNYLWLVLENKNNTLIILAGLLLIKYIRFNIL